MKIPELRYKSDNNNTTVKPSRILAVDHVVLEAPSGCEEALRWFYGEVAKLEETSDGEAASRGLCFRSEQIELRIRVLADPKVDGAAPRVTIAVPSLREAMQALSERRVAYEPLRGLDVTDRRIQVLDPAGNRVDLKQWWGEGSF